MGRDQRVPCVLFRVAPMMSNGAFNNARTHTSVKIKAWRLKRYVIKSANYPSRVRVKCPYEV